MAKNFSFGLALVAGLSGLAIAAPPASATDLTVTVEGVHAGVGDVVLGLYNGPRNWPTGTAPYKVRVPAKDGRVVYVFKGLAPGRYALTGYDDANGDGKMDYSFIGLPEEGFFFSNNKSPGLSPPSFEACAITLAQAPAAITVHIQHWGD